MQKRMEFILPLSRFSRGTDRQKYEVIRFDQAGIQLKAQGKTVESIPYSKLEKLIFINGARFFPEILSFLEVQTLRSRSQMQLLIGEKVIHLSLESGLRFQQGELQRLFMLLYKIGVPLEEQGTGGARLFLLERCTPEDAQKQIQELQKPQAPRV